MQIVALEYVSLAEIQFCCPDVTEEMLQTDTGLLYKLLHALGIDTNNPIDEQYNTHRTKMNTVVTTKRWVGNSRLDREWLDSGMASPEAIDKASGNRLMIDIYRMKGLAE